MTQAPLSGEQYQLIGDALSSIAPRGWDRVELTFVAAGPESQERVRVSLGDGRTVAPTDLVPLELSDLLDELRKNAYRPGVGTWNTATVTLHAAGRIAVDFNFDEAPPADLRPAPNSWVAEVAQYPRAPEHTPAWLAEYGTGSSQWLGARWQLRFRPADEPRTGRVDATTPPHARGWLVSVQAQLADEGVPSQIFEDQGEDLTGAPSTYAGLTIALGEAHMSLSFWVDEVFWTAEAFADQCTGEEFSAAARRVSEVVQRVTGYTLDDGGLGAYERSLLGRG